uniref:Uncharacterized protein n=1 Tax=Parascaris equorum TaxID=6256 RepID=A0A914RJ07_PAREQ
MTAGQWLHADSIVIFRMERHWYSLHVWMVCCGFGMLEMENRLW